MRNILPSQKISLKRPHHCLENRPEIKDPCVYRLPGGRYEICASVGHSAALVEGGPREQWEMGCFEAKDIQGPWIEKGALRLHGLEEVTGCRIVSAEVCAPAITYSTDEAGRAIYDLYVQSTCFQPDGAILHATSRDGVNYQFDAKPLVAVGNVPVTGSPLEGLYDASISDVSLSGEEYECLTFSGYRKVGCGDIYATTRRKADGRNAPWSPPKCLLKHEDMAMMNGKPCHNQPGCEDYEWGLEGAKIVQLSENVFVMVGVCFLTSGQGERGTRQRVFMAASGTPDGPYHPMCLPVEPQGPGENGHPDTVDLGEKIALIYQQRLKTENGNGLWHPCYAQVSKAELLALATQTLNAVQSDLQGIGFWVEKKHRASNSEAQR